MANIELQPTQRAYTLRLRGVDGDDQWRNSLWATHEAVNRGAKVFGDWLLTLRGGLDHQLADEGPSEQRKDRRILLALSWLTVEDVYGAPEDYVVSDPVECLRKILIGRGMAVDELNHWVSDCSPSLHADIRDGAVWVNRSAAFDCFTCRTGKTADRQYAAATVLHFLELKGKYFVLPSLDENEATNQEKPKEDKPLVNEATGWLCDNWGAGVKSNKTDISLKLRAFADFDPVTFIGKPGKSLLQEFCRRIEISVSDDVDPATLINGICKAVGWKGRKSSARMAIESCVSLTLLTDEWLQKLKQILVTDSEEKLAESKLTIPKWMPLERLHLERLIGMPYRGKKDHTFEFAVMLDHALRKVSGAHSWIKNAEAERRQFEADSQRIGNVPTDALTWLESHCVSRKDASGGLETYRIRRRAVDGWEQVVERWTRKGCNTPDDRIKLARELQDEIEKFGDIQLFGALAEESAECVWKPNGTPSAQILKDFVFATDAAAKQLRFKVPAYRHPDPLRHPIFADFGNSRWGIEFSAHRAPTGLHRQTEKVQKITATLNEAEQKRDRLRIANSESIDKKIAQLRLALEKARSEHAALADRHQLQLDLWNGQSMASRPLRWSSKRFIADLNPQQSDSPQGNTSIIVSRADRLSRAAAGADRNARVTIAGLFEEDGDWNGRLQAPRAQLDAIAKHVENHGWDAKAQTMVHRIRWLLSFSAKLTPRGPWTDLATRLDLKPDPQYWPHAEANKKRQGHGKLILSRLRGLRILAVDLGHRFAAACAVWEAIGADQMEKACAIGAVEYPGSDAMYLHIKGENDRGKPSTTIYRRIGPDTLPDGSAHPTPWARLDRQFLIKLQGEDQAARKASPEEIRAVEKFEEWAGLVHKATEKRNNSVDVLMSGCVRIARLALSRHARRARIASNLIAAMRIRPGGIQQPLNDRTRIELLTQTLVDWYALATDDRWNDGQARDLWNSRLAQLETGFIIEAPVIREGEEPSRVARRKQQDAISARLEPLAQALASNINLRQELHELWATRWNSDDKIWQKRELRWLARWLMPRGGKRADKNHRRVGGLSLIRISTLTEFRRKVQVAFFSRMTPTGPGVPPGLRFGQSTLDTLQKLKDNRTKQLASRIVEAALGVGVENHSMKSSDGKWRDAKRPQQRLNDPRFAPCHAVVIEDLTHYRPEETRTRRENRATMDWKSAEARKRLADHCQLHGLHLRDVNPQYTSRQDSRTGAPGWRCQDIAVDEFLLPCRDVTRAIKDILMTLTAGESKEFDSAQLDARLAKAIELAAQGRGESRNRFIVERFADLRSRSSFEKAAAGTVRVPNKSGDIFVSADESSPAAAGIQADLNAAANIGLRALMDPDFAGRWWYVPCDPKTKIPRPDKVKGSILDSIGPLVTSSTEDVKIPGKLKPDSKAKTREVVNLWRDPSPHLTDVSSSKWRETVHYWNDVIARVTRVLGSRRTEREKILAEAPF